MTSRYGRIRRSSPLPVLALCLATTPAFAQDSLELDFGPAASSGAGSPKVGIAQPKQADATWTIPPTMEQVNQARAKSRDAMTIDSVGGKELALRVIAPAGFAHVAFVAEAGT